MTLQQYGTDTFQNAKTSGWNPASDTQTWTIATGVATPSIISAAGQFRGLLTPAPTNTTVNILYLGSTQFTDVDCYVRVLVSSALDRVGLVARGTTATGTTYYRADVSGTGANNFELLLDNNGTTTQLQATSVTFAASTYYWLHLQLRGFADYAGETANIFANFWADPTNGSSTAPSGEPAGWMLSTGNSAIYIPGSFGILYKPSAATHTATFDTYTCTDLAAPATVPPYNTTGDRPYGQTLYVPNTNTPPFPIQGVTDLIGTNTMKTNPVSSQGWNNGCWLRYQMRWNNVETYQGLYDWAIMDSAVRKANYYGFRLLWPVQAPPAWRLTRDACGCNLTLTSQYTPASQYTSLNVSAIPNGGYLPHLTQITVDWTANPKTDQHETLYVWNPAVAGSNTGVYTNTHGTPLTIGISTVGFKQTAWTPTYTHNIGAVVWEALSGGGGPQYGKDVDYGTFCTLAATRYNGQAGSFGQIDAFQVENENYDSASRVGKQGAFGQTSASPAQWDGTSNWDNGGAILTPVYFAARAAIHAVAGMSTTTVWPCAVRKAPNTGLQHINNWLQGFLSNTSGAGHKVDGIDFHFYRDGSLDWDGTPIFDPSVNTYITNPVTGGTGPNNINAPSAQVEVQAIQNNLNSYNYTTALIMAGETGWSIYDDGNGPQCTLYTTVTSGVGIRQITVVCPWGNQSGKATNTSTIPSGTAITLDYGTGQQEIVYTFGSTPANCGVTGTGPGVIQITNDATGKAQTNWSPSYTHTGSGTATGGTAYSGALIYGSTTTLTVPTNTQSAYIQSMYAQLRNNGADKCFVYTMDPTVNVVTTTTLPQWSARPDSITQSINSVYTYEPAYAMTANESEIYPSWSEILPVASTTTQTRAGSVVVVVRGGTTTTQTRG